MDASAEDSFYPIAVFLNELKNDDVQARINSVKSISTVAIACGPERTRKELLSFINETIVDDDNVLATVAEKLGDFLPLVGGAAEAKPLLDCLLKLAVIEDITVREKSVNSIKKIIQQLPDTQVQSDVFPMIVELSKGSFFTSPSSACYLYPTVYPKVNTQSQESIRNMFLDICMVKQPILRRSAATAIEKFSECLSDEDLQSTMVPALKVLLSDEQDNVRLFAIEPLVAILPRLSDTAIDEFFQVSIKSLLVDKAWRVRFALSKSFDKLFSSLIRVINDVHMFAGHFISYLQDQEAEVRVKAASNLVNFCMALPEDSRTEIVMESVFPVLREMITDSNLYVKSALASNLMSLAPIIGAELSLEALFPLVLQMLRDVSSEVRMKIVLNLGSVNEVIGPEKLSEIIVPALIELAEDPQWRVRLAIIEFLPQIAEKLGERFFDEKMIAICSKWMRDEVFAVRECIYKKIVRLIELFGVEWAKKGIMDTIFSLSQNTSYLYRLTALFTLKQMKEMHNISSVIDTIICIPLNLLKDPVPNVRFHAALTLAALSAHINREILTDDVIPQLSELINDTDIDVKNYASSSLMEIKKVIS